MRPRAGSVPLSAAIVDGIEEGPPRGPSGRRLRPLGLFRARAHASAMSMERDGGTTLVERQALAALQRGDREEALELLMQAYGDALYRYCLRMMGDADAADDAHQMTFVQAYEGFERFAGRSSLRVWLYGIARHRCLDLLKTTRRRRRRFLPEDPLPEAPDRTPHAEDRVVERGLAEELRACLAALPARVREAVALRYQEGLSYPQMAELTGERPPTLQARVARAMPVLRRCLEDRGVSV